MKRKINQIGLLAVVLLLSSCSVFKKKCDCPSFKADRNHIKMSL